MLRIGLISDTHNLVRPEALFALAGVDRIIHAGDIASEAVLDQLRRIAPVVAVRGNNDRGSWAGALRERETIDLEGARIHVVHDLKQLDADPQSAGYTVVVSGHSHKPSIRMERGVLFVNPGSAGPRRFRLPISLALLEIAGGECRARIQTLEVD